jgi:hypothetical protein
MQHFKLLSVAEVVERFVWVGHMFY